MNKMKLFGFLIAITIGLQSCDKVYNPYLPQYVDVDTTLIEGGDLQWYKDNMWPTFIQNTNTDVNVLIEDFTGHLCIACPAATATVEGIEATNEERIFIAAIHASPNGVVDFSQQDYTHDPEYTTNYTNAQGLEIAVTLSALDPLNFNVNPAITINRKDFNGHKFNSSGWDANVNSILSNNDLKVNLQSKANYFSGTRGLILHTEVELLDPTSTDLYQVIYLIEDSLISPQKLPSGQQDLEYVHRDIHRGCIDGKAMGRKLTDAMKVDKDGNVLLGDKYYLNYSYKLPAQYNPEIMHLLIYVYDNNTKEILQVIKQDIIE